MPDGLAVVARLVSGLACHHQGNRVLGIERQGLVDESGGFTLEIALGAPDHQIDVLRDQFRVGIEQFARVEFVDVMHKEVWGQGFAPPVFSDDVEVVSQRLVGEKHLALKLKHQGQAVDGIWFGRIEPLPARVKLAYRLDVDEWQGQKRIRFMVEAAEL